MNNHSDELTHYGVPGMKWGHRKSVYSRISGSIRRKQINNANRRLSDIKTKQKQVNDELRELNSYEKNPSKIGSSKISTSIRRNQIKSLNKTKTKLNTQAKDNREALKELHDIDKHVKTKQAAKQAFKEEKIKRSRYGQTNGQIIAEGVIKDVGAAVISKTASKTATRFGKKTVADTIEVMGLGYRAGNEIRTGYRLVTNYAPKKKK